MAKQQQQSINLIDIFSLSARGYIKARILTGSIFFIIFFLFC